MHVTYVVAFFLEKRPMFAAISRAVSSLRRTLAIGVAARGELLVAGSRVQHRVNLGTAGKARPVLKDSFLGVWNDIKMSERTSLLATRLSKRSFTTS